MSRVTAPLLRTGFPFNTRTTIVGAGTANPLPCNDKAQASKFFWRVKELAVPYDFVSDTTTPYYYSGTLTLTPPDAADEKDLILHPGLAGDVTDDGSGPPDQPVILSASFCRTFPQIAESAGSYYAAFYLSFAAGPVGNIRMSTTEIAPAEGYTVEESTITVLGQSVPVWIGYPSDYTLSLSIGPITATAFWTYDGKYDGATGHLT
jgi:hypothetical protein